MIQQNEKNLTEASDNAGYNIRTNASPSSPVKTRSFEYSNYVPGKAPEMGSGEKTSKEFEQ